MKRKIRWGVIGSGGIAKRRTIPEGILKADNAELAAVCGRDLKKNEETARQFGAKPARTIEELLKMDVDAVYIATPVNQHVEQTRLAAAAGKHIFCEKPLGLTVAEAEAMIDACKRAKVQLGTAFMMRFHSQHQAAKKLVADGKIGKPVFGRAQLSFFYPPIPGAWRQNFAEGGGGALIDLAGHCLDLLEMCFDSKVTDISCMTNRTIQDYETEDSAVTIARFANDALATVDTFFCVADSASKNRLELCGSMGGIIAEGTIGQGAAGEMTAYHGDVATKVAPEPVNMYRAEIEEFSQALLDGQDAIASAEAGRRSQRLLAACYESARTGRQISIAAK